MLGDNPKSLAITAGILIVAAALALTLASTRTGQALENISIDWRFAYRGANSPSSKIVLVLEDEKSRNRFSKLQTMREVYAVLVNGFHKMGARVIGIDHRFEEPHKNREDSLFARAIAQSSNVVVGVFYPHLNEKEELESADGSSEDWPLLEHYPFFLYSSDSVALLPALRKAVSVGHLDILPDTIDAVYRSLPLLIKNLRGDSLSTAFSLKIVEKYFGMTKQKEIENRRLVLMPTDQEPIRIPITRTGEYVINHLGPQAAFSHYYSCSEMYDSCLAVLARNTDDEIGARPFADKIVLIGSLTEEDDGFPTPFAVQTFLPGVLLHATVIDNILTGQFLRPLSSQATATGLIVISVVLFFVFWRCNAVTQIIAIVSIIILLTAATFILFDPFRFVLPFTPILLFIITAATLHGAKEWPASVVAKADLEKRLQHLELNFVQQMQQQSRRRLELSSFMLFIFSLKFRDQSFFPHYLVDPRNRIAFWPRIKLPRAINNDAINKLLHSVEHLQKSYERHIYEGTKEEMTLRARLSKIGARLSDEFGMKQDFGELFAAGGARFPLNLVVSNLKFPWNWVYHTASGKFLCEEFAVGISFATERRAILESTLSIVQESENPLHRAAILFYGDWQGHRGTQLKHVRGQIYELEKKFDGQDCSTAIIHPQNGDFLRRLSKAFAEGNNLRVIHYTGHARNGLLDISPEHALTANMISEEWELDFPSRPLVFLNACGSGQLPETWDKLDHLSTEFLACGAGACIVTGFKVCEKTACTFALLFYDFFIKERKSAGEALKLTIQQLGEPDPKNGYDPEYDITRYFYQLFGDPTVRF